MKPILLLMTFIIFTLNSVPSWALGKLGHQLVCQLSYDLLSTTEQQQLDDLLAKIPKQHQQSINKYNRNDVNEKISFAKSCLWADAIKRDDSFSSFKKWHYINVSRKSLEIQDNNCQKNCITYAIKHHKNQLSADNSQINRVMALMFLGHWLGDIHQPLHVSFASDWGGNKNKVIPAVGECENLHWYWDECLLYPLTKIGTKTSSKDELNKAKFDYDKFKTELYKSLSQQLTNAPIKQWQQSTVRDWANESLQLVREHSFNYCQLDGNHCISTEDKKITLSKDYHQQYQEVLQQRILQAAVRLSHVLSTTL